MLSYSILSLQIPSAASVNRILCTGVSSELMHYLRRQMACYVTGILSLFKHYFTRTLLRDTESVSNTK